MHNNKFLWRILRYLQKIGLFLPLIFWLLLLYAFDEPLAATLTLLAAIIHEFGHQLCALCIQGGISDMRSTLYGFRIKKNANLSFINEFIIYAAGPLANVLAALAGFLIPLSLCESANEYLHSFIVINLATAFSNILPIKGYDGYGMLSALMMHRNFSDTCFRVLSHISLFISAFVCILALYIMARIGDGYWIYGIFVFSLVSGSAEGLRK